ncbi:isoleucine--tRNA ligase [Candidatus Peregrinibacteria bacterium]|nr:isoleucine--tRNA ligase [Candidatus Peregrinibacteria bacterium]
MFHAIDPKQSFPRLEEEILKYWKKKKIFEKSVKNRSKIDEYVFYDGPPFATGLPHYGHILAGTMKDVVPRYWTMRGKRVERVFGWDCHGLPVEYQIEKELGISGKKDIEEKMGIAVFNEECRKNVLRYTVEWEKTVERMGRWVDFKNAYRTMDSDYMESIWWVFKTLWEKKLIYRGHKSMHICPRCVTPLSNFEVTLGYKDVRDPSIFIQFRSKKDPNTYFLVWTTTPWTLPGNCALAVGADIEYVEITMENETFVLAKTVWEKWKKEKNALWLHFSDTWQEGNVKNGSEFLGEAYEPLYDFYKNIPDSENAWKIYSADFVKVEEGTGIVHTAPAFGEEDLAFGREKKLPFVQHVAFDGTMKAEVTPWKGLSVTDANPKIIEDLENRGLLFANEKVAHSYPHCWRCETPLLNYATESWFMKTEELCEKMIANNQKIHWMPEHLKDGRFGKWLEGVRDWCISRNRYWGTPLPLWKCESCEAIVCIGSRQELEKFSGKQVSDLHKHFVDDISFPCQCGGEMKRIPEVLDCWFESGSMPYAQKHYPFENKKWMEKNYPADFIAEGLDQTRGWFYTLHVLATALSSDIGVSDMKPAFKNVVVNGIVLAEDGNKMSKSKKNYPDPHEMFDKYGADAVRFYLMNSPVVRAEDLRFSGKGVSDVVKNVILPIWNAYGFFVMYANIDNVTLRLSKGDTVMVREPHHDRNRLDRWILSALHELISEVTREMDGYDLQAISPIYQFIQQLTNWYIRRSRRRFWKSENDADKTEAYQTLHTVLVTLSKLMAPWMPFVSEEIYRNLTGEESVHLADWPVATAIFIDHDLNEEFRLTQLVVNLGRRARLKANMKIRQPLSRLEVVLPENVSPDTLSEDLDAIKEELNVKRVEFLRDSSGIATPFAIPDARKLGPKYGAVVQHIIRIAKEGKFEKLPNGHVKVLEYELSPDEISMGYRGKEGFDVAFEDGVVVALDTKITEELQEEGIARDIVRQIQEMRKEAGYHVADRISVSIATTGILEKAVRNFMDFICKETLAEHSDALGTFDLEKKVDLEEGSVVLKVLKI